MVAAALVVAGCGGDSDGGSRPVAGEPTALPPDPGDAGRATVAGVDSDVDGVRDDIQRYIAATQAASPPTRAALRQHARAQQRLLLDAGDRDKSYANATALGHAIDCVYVVRRGLGRADHARLVNELRAEFVNTEARTAALLRADAQLGGREFAGDFGNIRAHCAFDTAGLPDRPDNDTDNDDDDEDD